MKIVAVMGSPRGFHGNTGKLLFSVIDSVRQAGAVVTMYSLSDHEIRPCSACEQCHCTGRCFIRDDFAMIQNALLGADGIILASPNYMLSVTAQLKAMMDRCSMLVHCQALTGKYAAAVVTSGSPVNLEVQEYMLRFLAAAGCWTVGAVGAHAAELGDPQDTTGCFAAANDLGANLAASIRRKDAFEEQTRERQAFFENMKRLVVANKDQWKYEYAWWQKHHGL